MSDEVVVVVEDGPLQVLTVGVQGPQGPAGPAGGVVVGGLAKEEPAGAVDGANDAFTLSSAYVSGSTQVYLNGLLQESADYDESSPTTVTLSEAPLAGDRLTVVYVPA